MAAFTRLSDGERVVARKVTESNIGDVSTWLLATGFPMFAVTEEMIGLVVVVDGGSPQTMTRADFAAIYAIPDGPDGLVAEYGAPE